MKKMLLALVLVALGCTQSAPIMQVTYSLDLPDEIGVSSNVFFNEFTSSGSGTLTTLTFTNDDGDVLEFTISSIGTGTFNMTGLNTMTGTFLVADAGGALAPITIENTDVGFINITGISGSGSTITGLAGDFQINIVTSSTAGEAVMGAGSMTGVISF